MLSSTTFALLPRGVAGWLADKIGRRLAFVVTLIEGAIFITLWVYTENHILPWTFGLAWSFGFLGFWGPSATLTAEVFPTRIRGAANGVVWAIAYFVGFVLFPSSRSRSSSIPGRLRRRSFASPC